MLRMAEFVTSGVPARSTMNIDGTSVTIEGEGPVSIVFVHGWPDTDRLWDPQVEALRRTYRCVRFTLPGFERTPRHTVYSVDEVVDRIRQVVERTCPGERVTLLLHDWGCVYGFRFAASYPHLVARVIGADVGDAGSRRHMRELGVAGKAMAAAYQLWLATAWWIGGPVGDGMARLFARLVGAPASSREITAGMGYPYAVLWYRVCGGFPRSRPFDPAVPMLYIYGTRKPFMLHSRAWADAIRARPGSRVIPMQAGHWMMRTRADDFNAGVMAWLRDTDP